MDVLRVGIELEKKLLNGGYGPSGSQLPGLRELSSEYGCSYVTMSKAACFARDKFSLTLYGRNYYVTVGRLSLESALERGLRKKRRKVFAIQFNELNNHYYIIQTQKLHELLKKEGYDTLLMISGTDHQLERKQLTEMIAMGVSGIFFYPHANFDNQMMYERFPLPVVAIGRMLKNYHRSMFAVDNYLVGQLAATHLIEKGYKRFFYIGYRHSRTMVDMRLNGFRKELNKAGYELLNDCVLLLEQNQETLEFREIDRLVKDNGVRTGVFCYHDLLAYALVERLGRDMSIIPSKTGIIGCDDLPISSEVTPTITSIHYPYTQISHLAVQTALEELERGITLTRKMEVKPRIIERQTTSSLDQ